MSDTADVQSTSRQERNLGILACVLTSVALTTYVDVSPGAEDSHRDTISTSFNGIEEISKYMPDTGPKGAVSILDTVYHYVDIVNQIKNFPNGLPHSAHIRSDIPFRLSERMKRGQTERCGCRCWKGDLPQTIGILSSTCSNIWGASK